MTLRNPVVLLALVAALSAFAVQSGELGSADTMHRLQTTHAIWTGEPQIFPQEFPEFNCMAATASFTAGTAWGNRC